MLWRDLRMMFAARALFMDIYEANDAARARSAVRWRAARLTNLSMDLARRGLNTAALSLRLLRARDPFDAGWMRESLRAHRKMVRTVLRYAR